jgi:hypothetical protein
MDTVQDTTSAIEEEIKEIANLLSKAAKNYQMYLSNNRMFLSSLENLKTALERFLDENDVLTFVVREFELAHHNVPVYTNNDKYQSIAFRMYRDGVRLISFHRGITGEELQAFFEALTKCMETDNLEEDFVTLLWEKDLQAITYYEVNDFEADYDRLKKGPGKPGSILRDPGGPDSPHSRWAQVSSDVEKLKPTLSLTAEDLQEVRDLAFTVEDDLFLRRAWQVFATTFEVDCDMETYVELENALIGFLDTCVAHRQLGLAADALTRIRSIYEKFDDEQVSQVLARILTSRHNERNLAGIEEILAAGREVDHVQCLAYLSRFSEDAVAPIMGLLPVCARLSARQAVVSSVAVLGETCPNRVVDCVDVESADQVEAALDILDAIGTEEAASGALQFSGHTSPRIRGRVASLAGNLRTSGALKVVKTLVWDPDHSVRRRAVVSLVRISGEQAVDTLTDLFTSKEFNGASHDCKLSMLLAIRSLPPDPQRKMTEKIFRMRSLFRRKSIEDTKIALTEIIHLMQPDVSLEVLEAVTSKSSGKLRRAARAALKKVKDANRDS